MNEPRIASIHVGKVAPLGGESVPSGFVKHAVAGPVRVTLSGIQGDEQADHSVHGGPEKAVYGYATSHYAAWQSDYPQHSLLLVPGGFGENLAIDGLSEGDLCVGDIHGIGSARLQVCQPREPCFKLALRFSDKHMPRLWFATGAPVGTTAFSSLGSSAPEIEWRFSTVSIRLFPSHVSSNS